MRFGIALPNDGPLASPETLGRLAERAHACGADSVWVSDRLVAPVGVASVYPCELRLGVSAYVMPYRNPVVTAKQVASLEAERVLEAAASALGGAG